MSVYDKMKALANAIRDKSGRTDELSLDDMTLAVQSIQTGCGGGANATEIREEILFDGIFRDENIEEIPVNGLSSWKNLKVIDMPNVKSVGTHGCSNCTGLTTFDFPKCTTADTYAFYNGTGIKSVNLPSLIEASSNAFRQLTSIPVIRLPACATIEGNAFQKCTALEIADFSVVTKIGKEAFRECTALTILILRSPVLGTLDNVSAFTSTPIASGTGFIYVQKSLIDSYKTATNWATYASQFRAIEDYPDICA